MQEEIPQNKTPLRRPVRSFAQKAEEKKEKITKAVGYAMMIMAGCVDLAQAGLIALVGAGIVVNTLVTICAGLGFWIWFQTLGVSWGPENPRTFFTMLGGGTAEIIPGLNALPMWLAMITTVIMMTRAEDRGDGIMSKVAGAARGKVKF